MTCLGAHKDAGVQLCLSCLRVRQGCGTCNLPITCGAAACRHRVPEHRGSLSSCRGRGLVQSHSGYRLSWLHHLCMQLESRVEQLAMFGVGSRCPCLGAGSPTLGWFSLGTSYHQLFPTLCLLYPLIKICCQNSYLGLWPWEWTWPLSCQCPKSTGLLNE